MTEQQPYDVIRQLGTAGGAVELRRYPAHLVAEVVITAEFEAAGNRAFRPLFGYISGANRSSSKVTMTAPVVQRESTEIAMTAPVVQQDASGPGHDGDVGQGPSDHLIAFVLPAEFTLETAPQPTDPSVRVREVPASTTAAIRFSGRWTERGFREHLTELRAALEMAGLVARGEPRYARFDAPYVPAFLRRNEVLLDVELPEA